MDDRMGLLLARIPLVIVPLRMDGSIDELASLIIERVTNTDSEAHHE